MPELQPPQRQRKLGAVGNHTVRDNKVISQKHRANRSIMRSMSLKRRYNESHFDLIVIANRSGNVVFSLDEYR